jgi:signal transduction histidine kinase
MGEIQKSPFGITRLQIWLASVWTLFTLGLATWWMIFSMRLVHQLSEAYPASHEEILRHKWMLMSEGSILLVSLIAGGAALLVYMVRERAALQSVRKFFAVYTHDLKTALASLRLQTESLFEDLKDQPQRKLLTRLLQDTARLEVQLENSLLLANPDSKLWLKPFDLNRTLEALSYQFVGREVKAQVPPDTKVVADERALEAVFRNVLHNAFLHGKAQNVGISVSHDSVERVRVEILDDGRGFTGDRAQLGKPFVRHQPTSGSGLGIYLVKHLMRRMNGVAEFPATEKGFLVRLIFPRG